MSNVIENFDTNYTEIVKKIEENFSDLKAREKVLISSPKSIPDYIEKILIVLKNKLN